MADTEVADLKGGHAPAQKVGGVRMVSRGTPTKSESDKTDKPAKPTDEEVEEFGEDKEDKKNIRAIVLVQRLEREKLSPKPQCSLTTKSLSQPTRRTPFRSLTSSNPREEP